MASVENGLMRRGALLATLLGIYAPICASEEHPASARPMFSDCPVAATQRSNSVAKPRHFPASARRYRTVIEQESRNGPNFARHCRAAVWGCGTDCRGFAIVDLLTGSVYIDRKIETIVGVMGNDDPRLDFRLDSTLFVISGQINEAEGSEAKHFYNWDGRRLVLLRKQPLSMESFD